MRSPRVHAAHPCRARRLGRALVGPIAIVIAAAAAGSGCAVDQDDTPPTELDDVAADTYMYGFWRVFTRNGVREARLDADSTHMWRDSTFAWVYGLTLTLYDENGREKGRVSADAGRMSDVSSDLWAHGNAVLTVPADELNEAREIRADELNFTLDNDRIWTDSPVRMLRGPCQVTGDGFESDLSFNDLRILAPRDGGCTES